MWTVLERNLGCFCHTVPQETTMVGEGRTDGIEKYSGKDLCWLRIVCVGLRVSIDSSCCHVEEVLTVPIFNTCGKGVSMMACSIFCVPTYVPHRLPQTQTTCLVFISYIPLNSASNGISVAFWYFSSPPQIFLAPLVVPKEKKSKTVLFDAGVIDSEFLQNCFPSHVAETLGLENASFPFSL